VYVHGVSEDMFKNNLRIYSRFKTGLLSLFVVRVQNQHGTRCGCCVQSKYWCCDCVNKLNYWLHT